ncbi:hypothetical protein QJS66_09270 [Kocuria rhizophila]|nr:hypothetical protein QJS66_09270 [Kocuria rhizophila]
MALREPGLSWLVGLHPRDRRAGLVVSGSCRGCRTMQERIDGINGVLREQIAGVRVIRALVKEPFETRRFAAPTRTSRTSPSRSAHCSSDAVIDMVVTWPPRPCCGWPARRPGRGWAPSRRSWCVFQMPDGRHDGHVMLMMVPRAVVSAKRVAIWTPTAMHPRSGRPQGPARSRAARVPDVTSSSAGAGPRADDVCFHRRGPGGPWRSWGPCGSGKSTLMT